jgi:hypothetical protein
MNRPVVYLETSFVSCLTGWWSPLEHIRARQAASRAWWATQKDSVRPVVSFLVWKEIADGDEECAAQRAECIRGLPSWKTSPEAKDLAARLLAAHAIPETDADDAWHVALAAVGGADVLLTWNCRHINNPVTLPRTVEIVFQAGFRCPAIATPQQLLERWEEDRP